MALAGARGLACDIIPVTSEEEAVAAFRRGGIDLVLLDFHLSQGDGLACLRRLRALDELVPIVALSGLEEAQVAARLLEAGADDFLSKRNFSGPHLARAVSAAVARADAVRQRGLDGAAEPRPAVTRDERELLFAVAQLRRGLPAGGARPEQVERLAEAAAAELGADRRALLTLFLRLFGGDQE
jgi:DNA-binding response OmpR family regulator